MSPSKDNINIRSLDAIDVSMAVNMIIARSSAAKRCILSFPARQMGRVRMDFHLHREHPCVSPPRQIYVLRDGAGILSAFSSASRRIRILRMVGSVSVSIFFSKFLMLLRCTKSSWMLGIARSFPEGSSQTKRDVTRFTTMRPTICTLIVVFCCSAQAAYLELLFTSWGAESAAAAPVDSKPPATGSSMRAEVLQAISTSRIALPWPAWRRTNTLALDRPQVRRDGASWPAKPGGV